MNDDLRKQVKLLKAFQGVTYKELAEHLAMRQDSFYCWLKGYYDFGINKQKRLKEIIAFIKE